MADIVRTQDSRRTFIDTLIELAENDPRIVLIIPDVGFLYVEEFQKRFPDRFFNLGTTEASTMCIAGAMGLAGLRPFVYSMINFVAFRPFEMVRNIIALHDSPVVLLGVKGSASYKFLGFSHNPHFEDEDIFHLHRYMECYKPQDNEGVRETVLRAHAEGKPAYIRL